MDKFILLYTHIYSVPRYTWECQPLKKKLCFETGIEIENMGQNCQIS